MASNNDNRPLPKRTLKGARRPSSDAVLRAQHGRSNGGRRSRSKKNSGGGLLSFFLVGILLPSLAAVFAVMYFYNRADKDTPGQPGGEEPAASPSESMRTVQPAEPDSSLPDMEPDTVAEPDAGSASGSLAGNTTEPPVVDESALADDAITEPGHHDHLKPPLLFPADREILLQAGVLDGTPALATDDLSVHEYRRLSYPEKKVIPIAAGKIEDEFPQRILAEQSVVLHINNLPREPLRLRGVAAALRHNAQRMSIRGKSYEVRVMFNGKTVCDKVLIAMGDWIEALVPSDYIDGYDDTITITNRGAAPIVFDALWLEKEAGLSQQNRLSFRVSDYEELPPYARTIFAPGVPPREQPLWDLRGLVCQGLQFMQRFTWYEAARREVSMERQAAHVEYIPYSQPSLENQERYSIRFLYALVQWYERGGNDLYLRNLRRIGALFEPRTGRPYPMAYALRMLGSLFVNGEAPRFPINVVPVSTQDDPTYLVSALATRPSEDTAVILLTTLDYNRHDRLVRVVARLPWEGPTEMEVTVGMFPESLGMVKPRYRGVRRNGKWIDKPGDPYRYPQKVTVERFFLECTADGEGNLNRSFFLRHATLIRLRKKGAEWPETRWPEPEAATPPRRIQAATGPHTPRVSLEHGQPLPQFTMIPPIQRSYERTCRHYEIIEGDATPGRVGSADYVVPLSSRSIFFKMGAPEDSSPLAEAVIRPVAVWNRWGGTRRVKASFWVRPAAPASVRGVNLGLSNQWIACTVRLRNRRWQRVEWVLPEIPGDRASFLGFYSTGNKSVYDQCEGERAITFEINGLTFSKLSPNPIKHANTRIDEASEELQLIMLGTPGSTANYRLSFNNPVAVDRVEMLYRAPGEFAWNYDEKAQVLTLENLSFPQLDDPALQDVGSLLTVYESELCKNERLAPLMVHIRRKE